MLRKSYIDAPLLAAQFSVGDTVHLLNPVKGTKTSYAGRVTAVLAHIGFLDVEFPHGNVRVDPTEVVRAEESAPQMDTSLSTWERRKSTVMGLAAAYHLRLQTLVRVASDFAQAGISQMDAYDFVYGKYGKSHSDLEIKGALNSVFSRTAMYWKQKGRQYAPTQSELSTGCFTCPRCSGELENAVYKKHTKLLACKGCLFLIKPGDILDSLKEDERSEVEKSLGWEVRDPSKSVNEWL